jgi:uracil-DNA glycosylase
MSWESTQAAIQSCRRCEAEAVPYLCAPISQKRRPPWEPLRPIRLFFVSVAPPWGGAYFWDESRRDAVRDGLFAALRAPLGVTVTTCRQFCDLGLFLVPAVKCPSSKNDKDHPPSRGAIRHCGGFLRDELLAAQPDRILALGRVPFDALCKIFGIAASKNVSEFRTRPKWVRVGPKEVPLAGTYFSGNNRHRGFPAIVQDIDRLLELTPRQANA